MGNFNHECIRSDASTASSHNVSVWSRGKNGSTPARHASAGGAARSDRYGNGPVAHLRDLAVMFAGDTVLHSARSASPPADPEHGRLAARVLVLFGLRGTFAAYPAVPLVALPYGAAVGEPLCTAPW